MKRTVAYLGPANTHTHAAARSAFGRGYTYAHEPTVEDVFKAVERRQAVYGVVPVENSLEGSVTHTLDRFIEFLESPVEVHGEVDQLVAHYLITRPGVPREAIRVVYSHPQALGQCRRWLRDHLPGAACQETGSTSEAVARLLAKDPFWKPAERAAIARRELAVEHRLRAAPIPLDRENRTRFLILGLGRRTPRRGRACKTSLLFSLKDRAGALHDALLPFKRHRINLTKIESRPSKQRAWEYYFFVDVEGDREAPVVAKALRELERQCPYLKVLGSYPISRPYHVQGR